MDDAQTLDDLITDIFADVDDTVAAAEEAAPPELETESLSDDGAVADFDEETLASDADDDVDLDVDLDFEEAKASLEADPPTWSGPSPEDWEAQQQAYIAQQQMLQRYVQAEQQRQAQAQYAAFRQRLEQMDPDDAHRAELQWVSQMFTAQNQQLQRQLASTQAEQAAYAEAQAEAEAKPLAIQHAISKHKLRPEDADILMTVTDASQLDPLSLAIKEQRRQQTEAARARKAANLVANPALKAGPGGKPAPAPAPELETIDDIIADALGDWSYA